MIIAVVVDYSTISVNCNNRMETATEIAAGNNHHASSLGILWNLSALQPINLL